MAHLALEHHFCLRKQILQRLCEKNLKWDTKLPEDLQTEWGKWKIKLPALQEVHIKRCFMHSDFEKVEYESGYGQVSYLRLIDDKGNIHCSLVMGKSQLHH